MTNSKVYNLAIIGGGPSGLSAAINAASEMSGVLLFDSGKRDHAGVRQNQLGGQAIGSTGIENYPGFEESITGFELMRRFVAQAKKFGTEIRCPERVESISVLPSGNKLLKTKEGGSYEARAVLVTCGLSYRKMDVPGVYDLIGKGVLYGAPTSSPYDLGSCTVCIVGAANSAGQAVVHLAENPGIKIMMLVRDKKGIEAQMSEYLVDRIRKCPNVEVVTGAQVRSVKGVGRLESVDILHADGNVVCTIAQHLFIFIGASPKTEWLSAQLHVDKKGFILTGFDLPVEFQGLPYQSSVPGIFAVGDVRANSVKRVAAAGGEGAGVIATIHRYLAPDT